MGALTHREQLSSHPLIGSPRFITIHLGNRLLSCPACCKFAVSSVIHTTLRRDEASKLRHHRVLQGSPFSWCDAHGFLVGCGGQETSPKGRAQSFSRARFWIQALNWEILRAWHSRRRGRGCLVEMLILPGAGGAGRVVEKKAGFGDRDTSPERAHQELHLQPEDPLCLRAARSPRSLCHRKAA